jgi:hypothetical protein
MNKIKLMKNYIYIIGGWGKLHNEELQNFSSSPNIMTESRRMRLGRACNTHGKKSNAHRVLVGNPEEKRPL